MSKQIQYADGEWSREQSTPTPTDELVSLLSWAWARNLNFPMIETNGVWATDITGIMKRVAKKLRAAGWKSPAEVAELVRAGAEKAWDDGADAAEADVLNHERSGWGNEPCTTWVNPYIKPTTDRTEESDV